MARSQPTASMTTRTSSIRSSTDAAPGMRSEDPVPRLSNRATVAKLPHRSKKWWIGAHSQKSSTFETAPVKGDDAMLARTEDLVRDRGVTRLRVRRVRDGHPAPGQRHRESLPARHRDATRSRGDRCREAAQIARSGVGRTQNHHDLARSHEGHRGMDRPCHRWYRAEVCLSEGGSMIGALILGLVAGALARLVIPNDALEHLDGWKSWLATTCSALSARWWVG